MTRLDRFMHGIVPLSAAGVAVGIASIFVAAAYDWWLHTAEAVAFLLALACAWTFGKAGRRWRALLARVAGGSFLAGLFLALLPLSCG